MAIPGLHHLNLVKIGKLRGVFIFDTSMDSVNNGQFTYELTKAIAAKLGK